MDKFFLMQLILMSFVGFSQMSSHDVREVTGIKVKGYDETCPKNDFYIHYKNLDEIRETFPNNLFVKSVQNGLTFSKLEKSPELRRSLVKLNNEMEKLTKVLSKDEANKYNLLATKGDKLLMVLDDPSKLSLLSSWTTRTSGTGLITTPSSSSLAQGKQDAKIEGSVGRVHSETYAGFSYNLANPLSHLRSSKNEYQRANNASAYANSKLAAYGAELSSQNSSVYNAEGDGYFSSSNNAKYNHEGERLRLAASTELNYRKRDSERANQDFRANASANIHHAGVDSSFQCGVSCGYFNNPESQFETTNARFFGLYENGNILAELSGSMNDNSVSGQTRNIEGLIAYDNGELQAFAEAKHSYYESINQSSSEGAAGIGRKIGSAGRIGVSGHYVSTESNGSENNFGCRIVAKLEF